MSSRRQTNLHVLSVGLLFVVFYVISIECRSAIYTPISSTERPPSRDTRSMSRDTQNGGIDGARNTSRKPNKRNGSKSSVVDGLNTHSSKSNEIGIRNTSRSFIDRWWCDTNRAGGRQVENLTVLNHLIENVTEAFSNETKRYKKERKLRVESDQSETYRKHIREILDERPRPVNQSYIEKLLSLRQLVQKSAEVVQIIKEDDICLTQRIKERNVLDKKVKSLERKWLQKLHKFIESAVTNQKLVGQRVNCSRGIPDDKLSFFAFQRSDSCKANKASGELRSYLFFDEISKSFSKFNYERFQSQKQTSQSAKQQKPPRNASVFSTIAP